MKEKAITLIRVSTKGQDNEQQLPANKEYIKSNNWELCKVFREKGSAYKKDFEEREVWVKLIKYVKENKIKHLVVWNMDRYSRLEPERVLTYTKQLNQETGLKIHAVKGDSWSEVIKTISNLEDLGHIGKALGDFLEALLSGMEHQRAYNESLIKSERVKLKVDKTSSITKSTYGKKWGRRQKINYSKIDKHLIIDSSLSIRQLEHLTKISRASIHKYLQTKKEVKNDETKR